MSTIHKLAVSFSSAVLVVYKATSREEIRISQDTMKLHQTFRSDTAALKMQFLIYQKKGLFEKMRSSEKLLEESGDLEVIAKGLLDQAGEFTKACSEQWTMDLSELSDVAGNLIPQWYVHKDTLLSCPELQKTLMENPNLSTLNTVVDALTPMLQNVQKLHKDGHGIMVGPEVMKSTLEVTPRAIPNGGRGQCPPRNRKSEGWF